MVNIVAWVLSFVLAIPFVAAGGAKLADEAGMVRGRVHLGIGGGLHRTVGLLEVVAGMAVLVATVVGGAFDWLGFAAAVGLIALMMGAVAYHRRAGDRWADTVPALVMAAIAVLYLVVLGLR